MSVKPARTVRFQDVLIYEYPEGASKPVNHLVLSFPDTGLVSSIIGRHLVVHEGFKLAGEVDLPQLHSISVVHDGRALSPVQIYRLESRSVMLVLSEVPLPPDATASLIDAVLSYSSSLGVKSILAVTGIAVPNRLDLEKPGVFVLPIGEWRDISRLQVEELKEGFITGAYATLIREAKKRSLNALVIFVESFYDIPDPESAAIGLQVLSRIIGFEVSVDKLLEEAEALKLRLRDLMRQTRDAMSRTSKDLEARMPLMYT